MVVAPFVVGIDYSLKELTRQLDVKRNGVKILGLRGIGGVGKTTLSKALYNKLACRFTDRTFILNVKEIVAQQGIMSLQKKIIQSLFPSKAFSFSPSNVHEGREKFRQILQKRSRVVISTRNRGVLIEDIVTETFEVRELGDTDSLKLFSYHAFTRQEPSPTFLNISKQIVSITGGLPLALEVFGSFLFDKRTKKILTPHLQDILKISYNGLDDEEKCVYVAYLSLDQLEKKAEDVIDVMKGCGFRARIAFDTLTARSLVKVIDGRTLWMHDQIRDIGRQIVREEDFSDPGSAAGCGMFLMFLSVLQGRKGSQHIHGIVLDQQQKSSKIKSPRAITREQFQEVPSFSSMLAYIKELYKEQFQNDAKETNELVLKTEVFDPIVILRLLQLDNVKLEGNLGKLPSSLKWIQWKRCTLSSYYSNYYPSELSILDLSESQIERIGTREWTWRRKKVANKLIVMDISYCHKITAIPDLSMHKILVKLIAERCSDLQKIHRTIGNLKTLRHLNLRDCYNLVEFPGESLQELLLDGTAIQKFPSIIFHLTKLERLSLNNCHSFKRLPLFLGNLSPVKELSLNGSAVEEIPDSIKHWQNLHTLSCVTNLWLYGSAIEIMPESIVCLYYLKSLSLGNCQYLTVLPLSIKGLSSLHLGSLPHSIGELLALRTMTIARNDSIMELPESVGKLQNLVILRLTKCKRLRKLPASETAVRVLPETFGILSSLSLLEELDARARRIVGKLPDDFEKLSYLEFINLGHNDFSPLIPHCKQLKALPLPSSLLEINAFFRELNLANSMSLIDIRGIECLKSLKMLHMAGCNVSCASIVRSKLDKVAVKNFDNVSIPGSEIPSWFTPSEARHENSEIKAVLIAIVVSVNCAVPDDLRDELPVLANVCAQIGQYLLLHPLVSILKDGDIIQVGLGNLPVTGIELKKCGIHLVYESDDDYQGNEESFDETQQSVAERLTRFCVASNRESNIFSSNSAQEDREGKGAQNFSRFVKEIFCALKYLLFRRF
ncbi:unnamed protein product [Withania somnifera]